MIRTSRSQPTSHRVMIRTSRNRTTSYRVSAGVVAKRVHLPSVRRQGDFTTVWLSETFLSCRCPTSEVYAVSNSRLDPRMLKSESLLRAERCRAKLHSQDRATKASSVQETCPDPRMQKLESLLRAALRKRNPTSEAPTVLEMRPDPRIQKLESLLRADLQERKQAKASAIVTEQEMRPDPRIQRRSSCVPISTSASLTKHL